MRVTNRNIQDRLSFGRSNYVKSITRTLRIVGEKKDKTTLLGLLLSLLHIPGVWLWRLHVWGCHRVHHVRTHGWHQRSSHSEEHHPVPLGVDVRLLLFCSDLLKVSDFLEPSKTPIYVSMLIDFQALICRYRYGRHVPWNRWWVPHTWHHWEVGIKRHGTVTGRDEKQPKKQSRSNTHE